MLEYEGYGRWLIPEIVHCVGGERALDTEGVPNLCSLGRHLVMTGLAEDHDLTLVRLADARLVMDFGRNIQQQRPTLRT